MASDQHPFGSMLDKLEAHTVLSDADRDALCALPHRRSTVDPGFYLVSEGEEADSCCVLLRGFAFRSRTTGAGSRQILALHMRGDMVDLQNSIVPRADHSVQTLTQADVAYVPRKAIMAVALEWPGVGWALWRQSLIEASIAREWTVNLGRRNSHQRVSHFICELALLQQASGLAQGHVFAWPLTQEQLADVVGLTSVHVNRTIQTLRSEGLISLDKRIMTIVDWDALRIAGDFRAAYLHQHECIVA